MNIADALEQLRIRLRPRRGHPVTDGLGRALIIVEREPIYRQQQTAVSFAPELFGLSQAQMGYLGDDRIGRALDRLFDADRAGLLTEVVLSVGQRFAVHLAELHNDSTSVRFCGQYRGTYHAFGFAKYAHRYLAEFQYRFNRRFNMKTLLARLLHALLAAPATAERRLRLAEVSR